MTSRPVEDDYQTHDASQVEARADDDVQTKESFDEHFQFSPQPHCYIPTELCDDGGERWEVTENFREYVDWLNKGRRAPRQYQKITRGFIAKIRWLNRAGNCLDECDNVQVSDSTISKDGVHRIPVGEMVEKEQLPEGQDLIWMGELYSQHDNPAAAHRVYFSDISDLEGKPKQRIIVGGGGTKDHKRTNQQTEDIRKAMITVSSLAAIEGSQVRAFDPSMFLRQLDSDDPTS